MPAIHAKPNLYVLAGVNGAGKSSVGGAILTQMGLPWYNPDTFARALVEELDLPQTQANSVAWQEGMAQLDEAIARLRPFAFETTLGGVTVCNTLRAACRTHAVRVWYCGLSTPAMHIARVRLRVSAGGHDIATEKIHERWTRSRANLVALLPFLTELGLFDNSHTVDKGRPIPDPNMLLHVREGVLRYPVDLARLAQTPSWAQPIVEKALEVTQPDGH